MNRIELAPGYYPSTVAGRPVNGAQIFIGEPNSDPTEPANQKQVVVLQEDTTQVPVSQPIVCGAGGIPLYNGSPVTLLVEGNYSMTVLDVLGAQVYYVPNHSYDFESGSQVTNYAGMKAITDMADGDMVHVAARDQWGLSGSGDFGGGTFVFDSSNRSLRVGQDTQEGIYVAPNSDVTGASGAWIRQWDGGTINASWFGVFKTNADNAVEIQAALDYAAVVPLWSKTVEMPSGQFQVGSTLYIPQAVRFIGQGNAERDQYAQTRLVAVAGMEADMIRFTGFSSEDPPTPDSWWWYGLISNMAFYGDRYGTVGDCIRFALADGTYVSPQDSTIFENLSFRYFPQSAIVFSNGGIPLHIKDIKIKDCGEFGVVYIQVTSGRSVSFHLDNLSIDNCALGGILIKNCDNNGNIIITNLKSESYEQSDASINQEYAVIFDNCDRTSVAINGLHTILASYLDLIPEDAPKAQIRITGACAPSVTWNGCAARITSGNTNIDTSYVLNDEVTGRTFHARERQGQFNTLPVERGSNSDISVNPALTTSYNYSMVGNRFAAKGVPILASLCNDFKDLMHGHAYMAADGVAIANVVNHTSSAILLENVFARFIRLPEKYIKARSYGAYNPPSLAHLGSTATTRVMPASLGDFVMFTHGNLQSIIGTAAVSATNAVRVTLANNTGSTVNIEEYDLQVLVMDESAFSLTNSSIYDPPVLAQHAFVQAPAIKVPGARRGDFVMASFSLDTQDLQMSAYVGEDDAVIVGFYNPTVNVIDLASGVVRVGIINTDT